MKTYSFSFARPDNSSPAEIPRRAHETRVSGSQNSRVWKSNLASTNHSAVLTEVAFQFYWVQWTCMSKSKMAAEVGKKSYCSITKWSFFAFFVCLRLWISFNQGFLESTIDSEDFNRKLASLHWILTKISLATYCTQWSLVQFEWLAFVKVKCSWL